MSPRLTGPEQRVMLWAAPPPQPWKVPMPSALPTLQQLRLSPGKVSPPLTNQNVDSFQICDQGCHHSVSLLGPVVAAA